MILLYLLVNYAGFKLNLRRLFSVEFWVFDYLYFMSFDESKIEKKNLWVGVMAIRKYI
jgi:hypothetical protein